MDAVPIPSKIEVTTHRQYVSPTTLSPQTVLPDPLAQFRLWFTAAQQNPSIPEPEAVALATTTRTGTPSVRYVLLKRVDTLGFVFFTNYESRKAREIDGPEVGSGKAALAVYWGPVHRQVRVVGKVERVTREESEEYFRGRPVGSRVGAWASPQSHVVGEEEVAARVREVEERFGLGEVVEGGESEVREHTVDVPLPEHWGGYRIIPDEVEFWAGKPSRLHDRVRYLRTDDPEHPWKIDRLAP